MTHQPTFLFTDGTAQGQAALNRQLADDGKRSYNQQQQWVTGAGGPAYPPSPPHTPTGQGTKSRNLHPRENNIFEEIDVLKALIRSGDEEQHDINNQLFILSTQISSLIERQVLLQKEQRIHRSNLELAEKS